MLIRALNTNVLQKTQNTFVSTEKMIVRILLRRKILRLISMNFYWKHFSRSNVVSILNIVATDSWTISYAV